MFLVEDGYSETVHSNFGTTFALLFLIGVCISLFLVILLHLFYGREISIR